MRRPTNFPPRASKGKRWPDEALPQDPIHPATAALVADFAEALAAKLKRAEEKYGYSDGWLTQDWEAECRQHLREHLEKGRSARCGRILRVHVAQRMVNCGHHPYARQGDEVMTKALEDVKAERRRQVEKGWTEQHDDDHTNGWLARASSDMVMPGQYPIPGSWDWKHKHPDSPERLSRREQLVVGAALALAEIERIDRAVAAGRDPFPPPEPPSPESIAHSRRRIWPDNRA